MQTIVKDKTCCFFGHRKIDETEELKHNLYEIIENLIVNEKVDTFLFGSKSEFDELCHKTVTELKEKHHHIKRIYVRAEYPYIKEDYKAYLLKSYEDTYFPERIINSGRACYIERNCEMINKSSFCVVYYDENYIPSKPKNSGTKLAYDYAIKKKRTIINLVSCY
ncbi:MAG: hypothetical protein J6V58_06340 [Clostridia bacterium]|nr:hypothetical protein [Clostridia bacterium]